MKASFVGRAVGLASGFVCVALLNSAPATTIQSSDDPARIATPRATAKLRVGTDYPQDEILVRFKASADQRKRAGAHAAVHGRVARSYRTLPDLLVVKLPASTSIEQALEAYRNDPSVLYAEPNYEVHADLIPNDPVFGDMWGLNNTGQESGTPDADIDAPEAWDITTGSSSIVVAVIDTGVNYEHVDLAPNMFRNELDCNSNHVDDDGNGYVDDCYGIDTINQDSDPNDDNGHGTHVAGTIGAAGNDSSAVPGINWDVTLLACKFLNHRGSGNTAGAIACFDYVALMHDRGVNIVATNNSWGGLGFSDALLDAIEAQQQRGILCVAAAGNSGQEVTQFPADYYVPNVIAVAATTRTDDLAAFSTRGKTIVHLGAPGQQILSLANPNNLRTLSGTSMASPHVAGVAALLASQGYDWIAAKNRILASGDPLASLEQGTITGRRLNAFNALTCSNSVEVARLRPLRSVSEGVLGFPLVLAALNINCGTSNGDLSVTVSPTNEALTLHDDGLGVDQAAGDGISSATWTPASNGTFTVDFAGAGSAIVRVGGTALLNPEPADGDHFGYALSADDDAVLVGEPLDNEGADDAGSAYLFDASSGSLLNVFHNPDPAVSDLFGFSVAHDAQHALIDAFRDDAAGEDVGAAYVFDRSTGMLLQTFVSPNPGPSETFGWSLALAGDVAAVGAPRQILHSDVGPSRVYLFSISSGALLDVLDDPTGRNDTAFGLALAALGSELFVAEPANPYPAIDVFDVDPGSLTFGELSRRIEPPDGSRTNTSPRFFGWSLAGRNNHLLVGAPLSVVTSAGGRSLPLGAAYLYDAFSGEFLREFVGLRSDVLEQVGWSVALNDDSVVLGAPSNSEAAIGSGAAYRYALATGKMQQMLLGPSLIFGDNVGFAVGLAGNDALASGDTDDANALDAGIVYRFAPPVPQDAQKCYKAKGKSSRKEEVQVEDLLGATTLGVSGAGEFCNAVETDFEPVIDDTGHLACHKARATEFEPKQVNVVSELGLERVQLLRPTSLCVAASLNAGPVSPAVGDYTCYKARLLPDTVELGTQFIHLADPFQSTSHIVGKLSTVCLHASVNGQSSGASNNHYTCHRLKSRVGFPRFSPTEFQTSDRFGGGTMRARKPNTVCAVARQVDLPPIPGFGDEPPVQ